MTIHSCRTPFPAYLNDTDQDDHPSRDEERHAEPTRNQIVIRLGLLRRFTSDPLSGLILDIPAAQSVEFLIDPDLVLLHTLKNSFWQKLIFAGVHVQSSSDTSKRCSGFDSKTQRRALPIKLNCWRRVRIRRLVAQNIPSSCIYLELPWSSIRLNLSWIDRVVQNTPNTIIHKFRIDDHLGIVTHSDEKTPRNLFCDADQLPKVWGHVRQLFIISTCTIMPAIYRSSGAARMGCEKPSIVDRIVTRCPDICCIPGGLVGNNDTSRPIWQILLDLVKKFLPATLQPFTLGRENATYCEQ